MTRAIWASSVCLLLASLGAACDLESEPPTLIKPGPGSDAQQVTEQVVTRPILQPTESEGRICADEGAVVGRAQPGSTVFAQGPGGPATARANSSDGGFCLAVPLAKGQANRIEVYSEHPTHGQSDAAVLTLTHAGLECPDAAQAARQPEPTPAEREPETVSIIQVQASTTPSIGSDNAVRDGDKSTHAVYRATNLKPWDKSSDKVWVWLTLGGLQTIKGVRISWTDSTGRGTRYAENLYLAVSPAESPGPPPLPPVADFFSSDTAPAQTDWTYVFRRAQMNARGGEEVLDLSSRLPAAQHVALLLHADANYLSISEEFAIAEIEVLRAPNTQGKDYIAPPSKTGACSAL